MWICNFFVSAIYGLSINTLKLIEFKYFRFRSNFRNYWILEPYINALACLYLIQIYTTYLDCISQFSRGVRCRILAARLLRLCFPIPKGHGNFLFVYCVCQNEFSMSAWSFVQRRPTECAASNVCQPRNLKNKRSLTGDGPQITRAGKYVECVLELTSNWAQKRCVCRCEYNCWERQKAILFN